LSIQVKTFDEAPILSAKTQTEKHKQFVLVRLPMEYAGENITLLVDDQVFHAKADHEATVTLKKSNLIKAINKK
jgi:predicted PilT family ATPase